MLISTFFGNSMEIKTTYCTETDHFMNSKAVLLRNDPSGVRRDTRKSRERDHQSDPNLYNEMRKQTFLTRCT